MKTIKMDIRAEECSCCKSTMIQKANRGVFPHYFMNNQKEQAKKLGVKFISSFEVDYKTFCEECVEEGKVVFTCFICEDELNTSKIAHGYGDPKEYTCTDCFKSLTAKEYDDKLKELGKKHQWDFY